MMRHFFPAVLACIIAVGSSSAQIVSMRRGQTSGSVVPLLPFSEASSDGILVSPPADLSLTPTLLAPSFSAPTPILVPSKLDSERALTQAAAARLPPDQTADLAAMFDGQNASAAAPIDGELDSPIPTLAIASLQYFAHAAGSVGRQLEIGAADNPICPRCLQVDKYASLFDLLVKKRTENGRLSRERAEQWTQAEDVSQDKWAAARNGVFADAAALPFRDDSTAMILSKCFPWLGPTTQTVIHPILKEYRRVLRPGGFAVLLMDKALQSSKWSRHIAIARSLGFSVFYVSLPSFSGIVISKPTHGHPSPLTGDAPPPIPQRPLERQLPR